MGYGPRDHSRWLDQLEDRIMLNKRDREIAENLKRLMVQRGVEVYKVILFGSRARGDAEPDSDMDVLVIVERLDSAIRTLISHCAWEVGFESEVVVQSVVMTRDKAENSPMRSSLLMLAVQEEGVRI